MKKLLCSLAVLCCLFSGARAMATTVIYPIEAIADFWNFNAEDFHTKYGGIDVTGLGVDDEGWYVRYRHENLTYLFGPLADQAQRPVAGAGAGLFHDLADEEIDDRADDQDRHEQNHEADDDAY